MLECQFIDKIGEAIRSASASTEAKFVEIGRRLESSVEILGKVAATFDNLSDKLKSENLQRATDDLAQAASQVIAIGQAHSGEQALLVRLTKLTAAIDSRMSHMSKAVNGVKRCGRGAAAPDRDRCRRRHRRHALMDVPPR
jgi:hypothetical protein